MTIAIHSIESLKVHTLLFAEQIQTFASPGASRVINEAYDKYRKAYERALNGERDTIVFGRSTIEYLDIIERDLPPFEAKKLKWSLTSEDGKVVLSDRAYAFYCECLKAVPTLPHYAVSFIATALPGDEISFTTGGTKYVIRLEVLDVT